MSRVKPVVKTLLGSTLMVCSLVAWAGSAAAQGYSMLNPLPPSYTLLGFVYEPPKAEGWRQVESSPDGLRIIYAEQAGDSAINTRADFTAQAFPIAEPAKVPDPSTLTRLSMAQRIEEKKQEGTELVAMSNPQQVPSELAVHEYTLVFKIGGQDLFEHYFVVLAPDKSQYLAGKMVTQDKEFRDLAFFKPLQESIARMKFKPAPTEAQAPPPDGTPAAPASN